MKLKLDWACAIARQEDQYHGITSPSTPSKRHRIFAGNPASCNLCRPPPKAALAASFATACGPQPRPARPEWHLSLCMTPISLRGRHFRREPAGLKSSMVYECHHDAFGSNVYSLTFDFQKTLGFSAVAGNSPFEQLNQATPADDAQ